jgi:hypothetical protein
MALSSQSMNLVVEFLLADSRTDEVSLNLVEKLNGLFLSIHERCGAFGFDRHGEN